MRRALRMIGVLTGLLLSPAALAVALPDAPCDPSQFGCGGGPDNVLLNALTLGNLSVASQILYIAAGLAVLFIIWAGVQMIISGGDEGKITQYKWAMAYSLIGLSVTILAQFVVSVVGTQNYGQNGAVESLPINVLTQGAYVLRTVLNALFVMMMVVAGLKMVYAQGKADDYNSGKKMMYWAIVGAVLVNLAAALTYAVAQFFQIA